MSRLLYRQLVPMVQHDPRQGGIARQRQQLLDACEATMKRLATDPEYFAHPAKFLFCEVRPLFSLTDQYRVRRIIDLKLAMARAELERQRAMIRRDCAAFTRSGEPCRREPVGEGRYCPSHRHLEEVLDEAATVAA